jgi:histidinol-phosphate aminotransferase
MSYDPGLHIEGGGWLALHRNENLFVEPALLNDLAQRALAKVTLSAYPHPTSLALREKLAELYGVAPDNVFVGNGSDEVLSELLRALRPTYDAMWLQDVGYIIHRTLATRYGYRVETLPGGTFATGRLAPPPKPGLSVLDSPNAVTGHAIHPEEVAELARPQGAFLVWDNAYGELSGDAPPDPVRSNVVTVRSFSKFYGLAGARVGYCIGDRALIGEMLKNKDAFNVNAFSQALALEALARREHFVQLAVQILASRERMVTALRALGFEVRPPRGSFVLARHPHHDAAALQQGLAARRIAVRHFPKDPVRDYVRITVPPAPDLDRLLEALGELLPKP